MLIGIISLASDLSCSDGKDAPPQQEGIIPAQTEITFRATGNTDPNQRAEKRKKG